MAIPDALHACLHRVIYDNIKTTLMHAAFPLRTSPSKQNNKLHAIPLLAVIPVSCPLVIPVMKFPIPKKLSCKIKIKI